MPKTWNEVSVDEVAVLTESLGETMAKLTQTLQAATTNGMKTLWLPWTKETVRFASSLASMAREGFSDIDDQVLSFKMKRPCRAANEKVRAAKELDRRAKLKKQTNAPVPVKSKIAKRKSS